jgi:predicted DNA-binding transcriptional regulator AlpA
MTVDQLLSLEQVLELIPYSKVTVWRLVRRGEFPAPVKLGLKKTAFRANEIQAWIDARERVAHAGADAAKAAAR